MPKCSAPPFARRGAPDWRTHEANWPYHEHSEFWQVGRIIWHLQRIGRGPIALLLHGTGAGTHSWGPIIPHLQDTFSLITVDLPGHGYTTAPPGYRPSLSNMTKSIAVLLRELNLTPDLFVGHSAGAAIAIRLAVTVEKPPQLLVSVNGALRPFPGLMRMVAPITAKAAAFGGLASHLVARNASGTARVENLVRNIGSDPSKIDIKPYSILLQNRGHIQGALRMMAHWDLSGLPRDIQRLTAPTVFIAGANDRAVPPSVSERAAGQVRAGTYFELASLGHLAHEEAPDSIASLIKQAWDRRGSKRENAQTA